MSALSLPAPEPLARKLYSSRTNLYDLMIRLLGYPQGLTRFFEETSCSAWRSSGQWGKT